MTTAPASSPPSRWARARPWVSLLVGPLLLAGCFGATAGFFAVARGLREQALFDAVQAHAVAPATVAFAALGLVALRFARAQGLSLAQLGWTRPSLPDVALGLGLGAAVYALDAVVLYPLIQRAQPSFDPSASAFSLPAAVLLLGVAATAEDTLYRGYALTVLSERHGAVVASGVTSVAYALLTPGPELPLKLWAVGFGLLACAVTRWRRSLWPAWLAHVIAALGPKVVASVVGG